MKRWLDYFFIFVNVTSPFIGVIWFNWDITEVVFLYGVEIGAITLYHGLLYWKAFRGIRNSSAAGKYLGAAAMRLFVELLLIVGAFTIFIDSTVGHQTTLFDDYQILLQYSWMTFIPVSSLILYYGQNIVYLLHSSASTVPVLPKMWVWILTFPLPALAYSYILVTQNYFSLVILLAIITVARGVVEFVQIRQNDQFVLQVDADPLVLRSSLYSTNALIIQSAIYMLAVIGFLSVNPFTLDPDYSLTQSLLIYAACICIVVPWLVWRRITVQLDLKLERLIITAGHLWSSQRSVALADITRITAKRGKYDIVLGYYFKIKSQTTWYCSLGWFLGEDWSDWIEQFNLAVPHTKIPLPKSSSK